jgi:hypothetical protein
MTLLVPPQLTLAIGRRGDGYTLFSGDCPLKNSYTWPREQERNIQRLTSHQTIASTGIGGPPVNMAGSTTHGTLPISVR